MVKIDWKFFPHIRDLILDAALDSAPAGVIPALRLTERAVRDYIDRRLVEHVELDLADGLTFTKTARVTLLLARLQALASHVRVLDVYSGRGHADVSLNQKAFPSFPNARYVRIHAGCERRFCDLLCPSGGVASEPPIPRLASVVYEVTGALASSTFPRPRPNAARSIIPLPKNLECLARPVPCNLEKYVSDGDELVILLLDQLNSAPPLTSVLDIYDIFRDRNRVPDAYSYYKLQEDILRFVRLRNHRRRRCTVVGAPRSWSVKFAETLAATPVPGLLDRLPRFLTLEEWRNEITPEEWRLVETLPPCFNVDNKCPR